TVSCESESIKEQEKVHSVLEEIDVESTERDRLEKEEWVIREIREIAKIGIKRSVIQLGLDQHMDINKDPNPDHETSTKDNEFEGDELGDGIRSDHFGNRTGL
ncbi:hypothetical protein AYI68_g6668, partial [Smittium mucronatum]